MSLRIGLTGGIACGKSTVAAMFEKLGAHILDADLIARELVEPGQPALAAIVQQWGSQYLCPDGSLDRQRLRALIFTDPYAKQWLEALLHPQIRSTLIMRSQSLQASLPQAVLVWVVPLLMESKYQSLVDQTLVVDCPSSLQMERLRARPGWGSGQIQAVLAAQYGRAERNAEADHVMVNDGDFESLQKAVYAYWQSLHKSAEFA